MTGRWYRIKKTDKHHRRTRVITSEFFTKVRFYVFACGRGRHSDELVEVLKDAPNWYKCQTCLRASK